MNPECTLKHHVKECTIYSKERRKELHEEYFGSKKAYSKALKYVEDLA